MLHPARGASIQWGITVITIVLIAGPILPILYQSLLDRPLYDEGGIRSLLNYTELFTSGSFGTVMKNTLIFAVVSTIVSQIIGVTCAILLGRTNVPGRRFFGEIMLWPLFISHLILSFGWFLMYGPAGYATLWVQSLIGMPPWDLYSISGMSIVAGISQAPLAALYCLSSTSMADPSLEDAARTCGAGPGRTLLSVTLPLLTPAILYSTVLNFTSSLEMLSIPLIFGEPGGITLLSTYLYSQGISTPKPNYGLVATAATMLLLTVGLMVYLQGRLLRNSRRFVTVGGKAARRRVFDLGGLKWVAFAFLLVYAVFFILAPLGMLVLRAFVKFLTPLAPIWSLLTLDNMHAGLSDPTNVRAILNTLGIAIGGGILATAFVAVLTVVTHRSEFRFRRQLEYIALFPRAVPGLIAGIGFFYAMILIPPMGWLRNSVWILMLAYLMRYIPTGFGALSPSALQIAPDLDRSSRVMGGDWWTTCRHVTLPLMKPAIFTCFSLLFIHFLKEYSIAIFLVAPGSEIIGTTLLQYWVLGDMGTLAALATVQIAITVFFIYIVRKFLKVNIYG